MRVDDRGGGITVKNTTTCPICAERPDLRVKGTDTDHGLLDHSEQGQLAWEMGITREDNPDEWRELSRLTR